ncbi:MAG: hypothetical protein UR51_C0008G0040 [Candidatus Moranbacteria bacterium GW2011_GWF1_34_10]|nr:MAG: hypothetical protein UR51_C0008G0040 [Candidatus Moranbacteria bacterium GW2011_GWF1_34_10]
MKRGNAVEAKLSSQKLNFVRGLHYDDVERVAKNQIGARERCKRIDIIVKMNIKKDKSFKLPDGIEVLVKSIKPDGIIILDNWDEIDVLLIFP